MIFINGIEFEIKEKNFSTVLSDLSTAFNNPKEFLKKHTTLTEKQMEEVTEIMPEQELIEFVHKKLDLENEDTFVASINRFNKKTQSTEYLMLSVLIGLGYKYTELIKLSTDQLLECFIIEVSNNEKNLNGEYIKKVLLEKYSENNVNALMTMTGLDAANKQQTDEMNNLINSLNNL